MIRTKPTLGENESWSLRASSRLLLTKAILLIVVRSHFRSRRPSPSTLDPVRRHILHRYQQRTCISLTRYRVSQDLYVIRGDIPLIIGT